MLTELATRAFEHLNLPDAVSCRAIEALVGRTGRRLAKAATGADAAFALDMRRHAIAEHTDSANTQHYELPPEFFALMLGARRKYSCCLYATSDTTLEQAEDAALAATARNAALADGQDILELGCGWGSLSLWMAETYPHATITAVSNARPQRDHIMAEAARRGLPNLNVITADMNGFEPHHRFDRVVSVEMFEHMANWHGLLGRIRHWLTPQGRLFVHVFSHRSAPYRFDHTDPADWIARHFFTGGIMPSHALIRQFPDAFAVEHEERWNGTHYQRTAEDWLANFDANTVAISQLLHTVYGRDAALWHRRWRLFLLATAGLFGHGSGREWGVSHYRLASV